MKFQIEVVFINEDGRKQRRKVTQFERKQLVMETLGLSLTESKSILENIQDFVIDKQVMEDLDRRRTCPVCQERFTSKGQGTTPVKTIFGVVQIPNPRWNSCSCKNSQKTFRPVSSWLQGGRTPELLYLETKWSSLIPYTKVADLLKDVLPVGQTTNKVTIRQHLHAVAERMEEELGEEKPHIFAGTSENGAPQSLPDGPMTVGIDGGYVRAAHKQGCFEVIAGKSKVSFRRGSDESPPTKCFGFVQTYDEKPRRRIWEVLKSQGMQENQSVVFLSDGGEDVRQVQEYLQPFSEHYIDWFHITMRLTVLQQQTKTLISEQVEDAPAFSRQLESIKHYLWHGNVEEALDRLENLILDLDLIQSSSVTLKKFKARIDEFDTYIRNNQEYIPNFGEKYRNGETISTAFVESTINQVVSRRFVKKQQMQWTLRGAHLLLQTRTKVLNRELGGVFKKWYPEIQTQAA